MVCGSSFAEKIGMYYINCKGDTARLSKFEKSTERAGVSGCKQVCVDGRKFTRRKIMSLVKDGILHKGAEMTPIEVAIAMSIHKVLTRFVNSKDKYAILLEDDTLVRPDFVKNIDKILEALESKKKKFDVLYLYNGNFASTKSKMRNVVKVSSKIRIKEETEDHNAGGAGFLISKSFARRLIKLPIRYPYDMYMGYYFPKRVHLSVEMTDNKRGCWESPLVRQVCGGEYGTGASTQDYSVPTIDTYFKKGQRGGAEDDKTCVVCDRSDKDDEDLCGM
ncbi:putative glycosyltransferase [Mimivirus AB-566-O17]|uniref:Putative glycosyltransferase n=1 Tax=Mimivirus AB-566-O17 TaxID=1988039 RepID=A0A1X9VNT6_9VIRU|nr:putative glycosyltransferase [Mimivirus AB-566-O17]